MAAGTTEEGAEAAEDPLGDVEEAPAMDVGMKLGVPLSVVALVWAFVGPAHLLEVGRYELPIVASFVEPLPVRFFLYIGGVTFAFALAGGYVVPAIVDEDEGDAIDVAIGLLIPVVVLTVLVALLGFVFPALFYLLTGEFVRAGLIFVGVALAVVIALFKLRIAMLIVGVWSAPLWLAALVGAVVGQFVRGVVS